MFVCFYLEVHVFEVEEKAEVGRSALLGVEQRVEHDLALVLGAEGRLARLELDRNHVALLACCLLLVRCSLCIRSGVSVEEVPESLLVHVELKGQVELALDAILGRPDGLLDVAHVRDVKVLVATGSRGRCLQVAIVCALVAVFERHFDGVAQPLLDAGQVDARLLEHKLLAHVGLVHLRDDLLLLEQVHEERVELLLVAATVGDAQLEEHVQYVAEHHGRGAAAARSILELPVECRSVDKRHIVNLFFKFCTQRKMSSMTLKKEPAQTAEA